MLAAALLAPAAAAAQPDRPTVTLSGSSVSFYAYRLLLDANGAAFLDDGVLHVHADHITLDLHAKRYIAIGNVSITQSDAAAPAQARSIEHGDVFGEDLDKRSGLLVALDATPTRRVVEGSTFEDESKKGLPAEPLALPDFGGEVPFATASRAVAHLGADVRLSNARVELPGAKALGVPSYVYTYSSDPGYVVSNLIGASEDVPLYFGSTRNGITGVHFIYRPDVKFALGLDQRFVNGQKSYVLGSLSPIFGPQKAFNFTWQEQINSHTQQSLTSTSLQGVGTTNSYDVRDGVHRSFFEFNAFQYHQFVNGTLAWQSYDQGFAQAGSLAQLYFHLRSEYGIAYTPPEFGFFPFPPDLVLPQSVPHVGLEAYVGTRPLALSADTTMYATADGRYYHDTLPHVQTLQIYTLTLNQRVNHFVNFSVSASDNPIHDDYPTVNAAYASRLDTQTATLSYNHGRFFSLLLSGTHGTASTTNPLGVLVEPWAAAADVRFRVNQSLSIELGRSYFFGFEGQRFGTITFQVFP